MKNNSIFLITFLFCLNSHTSFFAQQKEGVFYFEALESTYQNPTTCKGKKPIELLSDTSYIDGFVRLTYKKGKLVHFYNDPINTFYSSQPQLAAVAWSLDKKGNYASAVFYDQYGKRFLNQHALSWNYKTDAKGRVIELRKINRSGQLALHYSESPIVRYSYTETDKLIEIGYFINDNEPFGGMASFEQYTYDARGNVLSTTYLDKNRQAKMKYDFASVHFAYNEKNLVIEEKRLDSEGNPIKKGPCAIRYTYDTEGNNTEVAFYNHKNELHPSFNQTARTVYEYNENKEVIKSTEYDPFGQLVDENPIITNKYDEKGRTIETAYWDKNNQAIKGTHKMKYAHNKWGRIAEYSTYDGMNQLIAGESGYAKVVWQYDAAGREIESRYFNEANQLVENGYAVMKYTYNEAGQLIQMSYFDFQGQAYAHDGMATERYGYDENGYKNESRYYNTADELTDLGYTWSISKQVNDLYGFVMEERYLGTDNEPFKGGTYEIKYEYDANYRETKVQRCGYNMGYFEMEGQLQEDCSVMGYKYDGYGRVIESFNYNQKGELEGDSDGIAITRMKYDSRGNKAEEAHYNTNNELEENYEGVAVKRRVYDSADRLIEEAFYNHNDELIRPEDFNESEMPFGKKAAIVRQKFDEAGNLIETANYDANNELLGDYFGIAITRSSFNDDGLLVQESFWNTEDKPTIGYNGAHLTMKFYNKKNEHIQSEHYTVDNQLFSVQHFTDFQMVKEEFYDGIGKRSTRNGYSVGEFTFQNGAVQTQKLFDEQLHLLEYAVFTTDEFGSNTTKAYLNEQGQPILCKDGYHLINLATNTFYGINGEEIPAGQITGAKRKYYILYAKDSEGKILSEKYVNLKMKPINNEQGYHEFNYLENAYYDKKGRKVNVAVLDDYDGN